MRDRKILSFTYLDSPKIFYCPRCRVPTNAVGKDQSTVASPAQSARIKERFAEVGRAEVGQRRREMKAEKRRWHKCFFSWLLGHAWAPRKANRLFGVMVRGETYTCGACGKTQHN